MGQNSDIHNIFESYSNKVLVKEQTVLTDADWQNANARFQRMPEGTAKNELAAQLEKMKPSASAAQAAGTPAPQSNSGGAVTAQMPSTPTGSSGGGISVGGLTLPPKPSAPNSGGGISVGGLTLPPTKQPAGTPAPQPAAPSKPSNGGGTVTAEMPATSQDNAPMGLGNGISIGNPGGTQGTPSTPQGSSASNIDNIKMPADLGGGTIGNPGGTQGTPSTPLEVGGGISIGNPEAAQETETPTKAAAGSGKKQSASGGGSIVDYLAGKNQAFDKGSRGKLAAQYGIQNYTGTAEQNTQLLNKLRADEKMPQGTNASGEKQYAAGTVPKAPANEPQQPQQQQGMGGIIGGASKLAGGAGNLAKKALIGDQPLGGIVGGVSKLAGGAGNLFKKALIGGGGQQQATAPVQQQATATTQTAPTQTAPTRQVAAPTKKQTAPVQQTASNNKGYVKNPGGADEYFKDEAEEVKIEENRNIAKFVKCLSEKNYSQAHNYLKKIVNSKLQKNLNKAVNKI